MVVLYAVSFSFGIILDEMFPLADNSSKNKCHQNKKVTHK